MRGWQREERHGWPRLGWAGEACQGEAGPVAAWQARTPHRAGFGQARQARHGMVGQGEARLGGARQSGLGSARRAKAGRGRNGESGHVRVRLVAARQAR